GDARGLRQYVRARAEQLAHLAFRLDVALLPEEPEPLGVVEVLARADREQHVVCLGVFLLEVMRVIGGRDGQAELGCEPEHPLRDELLFLDAVVLHLEPEPVRSERAREPFRARLRRRVVPLPQVQRDLTGQARRETDDALAMLRQDLLVDARPAVIALEEAYRGKLDEVLIARP